MPLSQKNPRLGRIAGFQNLCFMGMLEGRQESKLDYPMVIYDGELILFFRIASLHHLSLFIGHFHPLSKARHMDDTS